MRRWTELERAMGSATPLAGRLGSEAEAFERIVGGRRRAEWAKRWMRQWARRGVLTQDDGLYAAMRDDAWVGGPVATMNDDGEWWSDHAVNPTDRVGRSWERDRSAAGRAGSGERADGIDGGGTSASGAVGRPGSSVRDAALFDRERDRLGMGVDVEPACSTPDRPACACERSRYAVQSLRIAPVLRRVAMARSLLAVLDGGSLAGGGPAALLVSVESDGSTLWMVRGHAGFQSPRWVQARCYPGAARMTTWQRFWGAPGPQAQLGGGKLLVRRQDALCGLCGGRVPEGMDLDDWTEIHLLAPVERGAVREAVL